MEPIWYIILSVLIGTYIILDGYDIGAGMAFLFFSENEDEKVKITNSIRSIWDANEVWLIGFVGLLSIVFSVYSKLLFANFGGYILLFFLFLLLKTIFFNLMIVFNEKQNIKLLLGYLFGFVNTMLVVFISLIFANILRGVFISENEKSVLFVSNHFSPFAKQVGLFDWFTVLTSITILIAILLHGLGWIILKNKGSFNRKLKKIVQRLAFIEFLFILAFLVAWYFLHPSLLTNYLSYPFLFIFPALSFFSLFGLMGVRTYQKENKTSILTTNMIVFSWISIIIALYPRFIFSLDSSNLTAFNSGFDNPERFFIKWWIVALGFVLFVYSILVHKYSKGENKS